MNKNVLKFVLSLKIRRLRNRKGLSLKDLAEKSGLSHSYLNEIEKGKKYPKVEKLLSLSDALGIPVDELVSAKMGRELHPLLEFLESDLATSLPLSAFGIGEQDIYDLMSHSPEKFTSFLMTVSELAKSYDVSLDDLNKAALRAYLEVNANYFPYLEELATSYSRQIKEILDFNDKGQIVDGLIKKLYQDFKVEVDLKTLGGTEGLSGLKCIYKEKNKKKTLFLNSSMDDKQTIYYLVKELGAQQLVSDDSMKKRDPFNSQFGDLLLEYQTHYFAGAALLPEGEIITALKDVFEKDYFDSQLFEGLLNSYPAPPEVFMGRLTQLLPHHFEFNQLFFLRCNEDIVKGPGSYLISQELHLGQLHHPHGVSLRERYCRRWITTEILKNLSDRGPSPDGPLFGVQISQMGEGGNPYLCVSLGRNSTTSNGINTCFTLGVAINENFHQAINFADDPKLERRVVGRTCERCSLTDCQERVAPPTILLRAQAQRMKDQSIRDILES